MGRKLKKVGTGGSTENMAAFCDALRRLSVKHGIVLTTASVQFGDFKSVTYAPSTDGGITVSQVELEAEAATESATVRETSEPVAAEASPA